MKDYWPAKLISSVETVDSRKRLQKAVYLLQYAGCPLRCDYLLHYYGPYSFELAGLMGQLSGGFVNEAAEPLAPGIVRYRSTVTDNGGKALGNFEQTPQGGELYAQLQPFIARFKELNATDAWILELAATVAFHHKERWDEARRQRAKFKKVALTDEKLDAAVKLARRFEPTA